MLIDFEKFPKVDMENMNDVHENDIKIINELNDLIENYISNESEELFSKLDEKYEEWLNHTIEHFSGEEKMMIEKKFPPYAVHKQEHDNVLNAMKNVQKDLRKTKSAAGVKNFVQNGLVRWLVNHVQTMDTVTARFLSGKISLVHPIN